MLFRRMNINIKYISILYTDSCMLYYCNECLICTSSRADYNKHLQTNKHLKKQGNASVGITNNMTQIEVNANANINLNASNYIHLNIESKNPNSKILLGTKIDNTVPDEPVLLGGQTHDLLLEMCNTLRRLAGYLANANAVSSDGAIPVISVQDGGDQLLNDVNNLINKLGTIQSEKVFTV